MKKLIVAITIVALTCVSAATVYSKIQINKLRTNIQKSDVLSQSANSVQTKPIVSTNTTKATFNTSADAKHPENDPSISSDQLNQNNTIEQIAPVSTDVTKTTTVHTQSNNNTLNKTQDETQQPKVSKKNTINTTNINNDSSKVSPKIILDKNSSKTSNNLSDAKIYSKLKIANEKSGEKGTAITCNLNDYKIINGDRYYNVYEYSVSNKDNDWVYNGNYSDFLGAKYMDVNGNQLNTQFVQDFSNFSTVQKKEEILSLAKQFTNNFDYRGNISVDMSKIINFDGYECYLVNWGTKSFYMNPAGFIYINKSQSFY